jgi:ribosomal protein L7/L12
MSSSDDDLADRVRELERKVDFLVRHLGLVAAAAQAPQAFGEVLALKRAGRLIDAIKLYREITGVGLREAKDYVDRLQ